MLLVYPKLLRRNTELWFAYIHSFLCQANTKLNLLPYIRLHVWRALIIRSVQIQEPPKFSRLLSNIIKQEYHFSSWLGSHRGPVRPLCWDFDITVSDTDTLSRTPLDEWSVRRRDQYMRRYNNRDRHPRLRRDSNPPDQQAGDPRPTP